MYFESNLIYPPRKIIAKLIIQIVTTGDGGKIITESSLLYEGGLGESHVFTKAEIRDFAKQLSESVGYKINSASFKNITVACGQEKTVKFNASKIV